MERGILTKYIENDVNTISVVKELPRKLYIILCFYTMWCLFLTIFVIYLTKKGYKLPAFLWRSAFSLTAAVSLCGSYMGYMYTSELAEKFKVNKLLIYFTDAITHILPLIIIFKMKNWMKINSLPPTKTMLYKMLTFNTIFGAIYLYLFGTNLYVLSPKLIIGGASLTTLATTLLFSKI